MSAPSSARRRRWALTPLFFAARVRTFTAPRLPAPQWGAIFRENIVRMDIAAAAEYIHSRGMKLYGAALSERAADIRTAELKDAVVAIGSEGRGLSAELLSLCDGEVIIPMTPGSESFNAAIAAAIVMWEIVR